MNKNLIVRNLRMLKENFEWSKIQTPIQGLYDLMCLSSSAFITSAIDSGDEVIWGPGSLSFKGGLSIQKDPCQGSISSACSNILSAWVIRRAGAIHIIESPSLSKEIIWSACHSWVHNSTLWRCACGAQWFSGILFSSPGQTGERWLRFYEACWASGEPRLNEGWSALPGCLTPSGLIVCGVSGQRSAFVCGHRGHGGPFVCVCGGGPRGSQRGHRALHPSGTAAGGGDFHAANYAAQTRFLWLFYYTHFFRDHHFAGNWSDVFTARQSSLCSLFVKYCTAALPTDSSQLYFGGISSLSSPPSPQRRGKGGLRDSSGTSWISALSSLSPPDPLPLLPPWLDSSARGGETWIRFTLNGPLMRSKYSERMLKWGDGESSSFFLIGPPFIESLSGLIALTVWSGIDFWHCNTTIQKTAICSLIKPRWEMLIYRELERTVTVIMTQSVDNLFIKLSYLVSETLQVPRALGYIFKLPPAVQLWENWLIQDAANSSLINGFKCNNSSYWDTGLFTL